jgi:hypothetical protein
MAAAAASPARAANPPNHSYTNHRSAHVSGNSRPLCLAALRLQWRALLHLCRRLGLRVGEFYPGLLFQGLGVSAITPGLDVGLPNADQALHCVLHAENLIACRQTGRARLWTRPFHLGIALKKTN